MTKRDDFSSKIVLQIAKRAGWLCSDPNCRAPTIGATQDGQGEINIGTAAHICAAAPGGPRYDATQTADERKAADNGIWMCRDHGKAIDSDPAAFPVEMLRAWKRQAEDDSWHRVVRHNPQELVAPKPATNPVSERVRAAAQADLERLRTGGKWPATTLPLPLQLQGFDAPLTTQALAQAGTALQDMILVAPPGMGKTTTLLQIAEGLLANATGTPLFVALGEWAAQDGTLLESILRRAAFAGLSDQALREAAGAQGVWLLLDGWNELDAAAAKRARIQVEDLKAELPALGLIVSTRRQALDVPFSGARLDIMPLNEDLQAKIARTMRGQVGVDLIDRAWRTAGVRDLVTIPLYLTALLSLPDGTPFPETKDAVICLFVAAHEHQPQHAETLRAVLDGFQSNYLEALAVAATTTGNTTLADTDARPCITRAARALEDDGQISARPAPNLVLDTLVSDHLLIRSGDSAGFTFQHQQFQEWYAARWVQRRILDDLENSARRTDLLARVFDLPVWEEAILFAVDRLARGDQAARRACANAILAAWDVDPMLAAEMVYRATDAVWVLAAPTLEPRVRRWHRPGQTDRALIFMLTSGRPEFQDILWPVLASEDRQNALWAMRQRVRFRPGILGPDAAARITALPIEQRLTLLYELAARSGMDGMDLATDIAIADPDPQVKIRVVEALSFRRGDNHVARVLGSATDETIALAADRNIIDIVEHEGVREMIARARGRLPAEPPSLVNRLRAIVNPTPGLDLTDDLIAIIATEDLRANDFVASLVHDAIRMYPKAAAEGLLARVRAGRPLPYGSDDILAAAQLNIDNDDALLALALSPTRDHGRDAHAATSVLGPAGIARLIDAYLETVPTVRTDLEASRRYSDLQDRLSWAPIDHLLAIVMARAEGANNEGLSRLADLLRRRLTQPPQRGQALTSDVPATVAALIATWADQMLATEASRQQTASLAQLAAAAPSPGILPIIKRLLDDELQRYRDFREAAAASGWRQSEVLHEAQSPLSRDYQTALSAIGTPNVATLAADYLTDEEFGDKAALILADIWRRANDPPRPHHFAIVDFSRVADKRAERAANPEATSPAAETILAAAEQILASDPDQAQQRLAVRLATIALRLPHGQKPTLVRSLIDLAPREHRANLLLALVLSGETIAFDDVATGLAETFEAAKTQTWILTDNNAWALRDWLRLLPFVDRPLEIPALVADLPQAQRRARFLEEVVSGLAQAPSPETEAVLFALPQQDPAFYQERQWRDTVLAFDAHSAHCRLIDLIADGTDLGDAGDHWHMVRTIAGLVAERPDLRAYLYRRLDGVQELPGLDSLAGIVAECADDTGVLILVRLENALGRGFLDRHAIEEAVTERRPYEGMQNAYDIVPRPAAALRASLLAMVTDGGSRDAAARRLADIDLARDEHGSPEYDPRHPDLASGRAWPIIPIPVFVNQSQAGGAQTTDDRRE
ncbi:ATP-binding protein [Caulobacter sp. RHG1]|uniref:ATP-binding protein n=1 Tax=Caulobacter sp. (strain RHG1) TaxID=2545762 RepID=UPI001557EBC2|nr:ATP-binding protein [Caulobacter sp. RHG1]